MGSRLKRDWCLICKERGSVGDWGLVGKSSNNKINGKPDP